jgi:hypothetical protein
MSTATKAPKAKTKKPAPAKKLAVKEGKTQRRKRIVGQDKERMENREQIHDDISVQIFGGKSYSPMTDEDAKDIIGYEEEPDGIEWSAEEYMAVGYNGKKFRCLKNPTNRPFRLSFARRYASEMIRGKWRLNGETVILDWYDFVQSGQHRLIGLILAEQLRLKNPDKWADDYGQVEPITIETILVRGIEPSNDVVDTIDIGQKRSLGDIIFREQRFSGEDVTKDKQKYLSNMLAGAVRLVWIRAGGKQVSDAKHFPPSEALEWIENHPGIQKSVEYIDLESKKNSNKYIQPAYAAALLYLMATSGTDPDEFAEEGAGAVDMSMWDKACEFWSTFYRSDLKQSHPIYCLKEILNDIDASSGFARDEIVSTVVKCFNIWAEHPRKELEIDDLKIERGRDSKDKIRLMEEPRLGGMDTEKKAEEEEEKAEKPEPKAKSSKVRPSEETVGKQAKKGKWQVGDKGWVQQADNDPWFGEITEIGDEKKGFALAKEIGGEEGEWEIKLKEMTLRYPATEDEDGE